MKERNNRFQEDKLDTALLNIGSVDIFAQFAPTVVSNLGHLVSFDQAVVLSLDASSNIVDNYLSGVSSSWAKAYLEYYHQIEKTAIPSQKTSNTESPQLFRTITWADLPSNEFIVNCIYTRKIRHSIHFALYDIYGRVRSLYALDRAKDVPFSAADLDILRRIILHIDNLHRKFFLATMPYEGRLGRRIAMMEAAGLTQREKDLVGHLCDGMSPTEISEFWHIAPTTIHKHIAHIYKKMGVKTMQELLVRLLNERSTPRAEATPAKRT